MSATGIVSGLLIFGFGSVNLSAESFVQNVSCVATSRQVPGYIDEKFLVSDEGLSESPPGSGRWVVQRDVRAWNSNYGVVHGRNDESPIVEFRFAAPETISGMRIWNAPGSRGFKSVTVQYAEQDDDWRFLPGVFEFERAQEEGEFTGQFVRFPATFQATRVRLWCHATHRGRYGQPDVAGLVRVRFLKGMKNSTPADRPTAPHFPADAGLVNVTAPPYLAKGDGQTDDTDAIQRAMTDCQASRRAVYLPAGTYLVSATLAFQPGYFYGDNNVRGDGVGRTVIRLKDGVFPAADAPQPVITFGFQGRPGGPVSADWFNNNIRDLSIDVGMNPGAIGLQFYSNNAGAARDLEIRAPEGSGTIGLDLGYKDQNGPLLVQNLQVTGFDIGVFAGNSVNSQTLVDVSLKDQRSRAVRNTGQCLTIERLRASGPAPRVENQWGFLTLIDAALQAAAPSADPAITNGEFLCTVNLQTAGFEKSIASTHPSAAEITDPDVAEYFSAKTVGTEGPQTDLHLPRTATPQLELAPDWRWVNVRNFRRITEVDDSAAFQRAIDSGAEVVYIPCFGSLAIGPTVFIRGNVRRIVGFQSQLQVLHSDMPAFRIETLAHGQLVIEDLIDLGRVENASRNTVVIRNIQGIDGRLSGSGDVFLENTVGDFDIGPEQRVWARQLNSERAGTKLINRGGQFVVVGLKTERGGTLVQTSDDGRTEVLGGLCYTTNMGELAPMFVNLNSSVWAAIGEVCYTGDPFRILVREHRQQATREWGRDDVPRRFDFLQGSAILYDGRAAGR